MSNVFYVDKNLKPKKLTKTQKNGLSDDGFINLIVMKIIDDYIKKNDETLDYWHFYNWVLDIGYGLVLCDLMSSTVKKNDVNILTWDYNLYVKFKKEILDSPKQFLEHHKYRFYEEKRKKIDKLINKRIENEKHSEIS